MDIPYQDGEDVVMIGESQMKRFLKTVDTLTEKIEKSDPLLEQQTQREAERDEAWRTRPSNWNGNRKPGASPGFLSWNREKAWKG